MCALETKTNSFVYSRTYFQASRSAENQLAPSCWHFYHFMVPSPCGTELHVFP